MFHADHEAWNIVAHAMIAFLFLYRCITALPRFTDHAKRIEDRGLPLPKVALAIGFAMMLTGGLAVLFDYYARIGAGVLIIFTLMANVLYHDFWNKKSNWKEYNHALYTFCNNLAVIGGLIMISLTS
ncbi:MAG: DoxX family protein [Pseudomonadota bacterium]|nr:DoxX family protein [Pseudomonadota bacterium]